jgi:hypothetical protein
MPFTINDSFDKAFFAETVAPEKRGTAVSIRDMYGSRFEHSMVTDSTVHDANFAFLSNALAKLHKTLYEPMYFVTWQDDIPSDVGGGFVDYVEYYSVDWAGIMNQQRNLVGNNANYIPRVNAGLNQNRVKVYTYEVAYDLRFVELEKMKQLTLQKSMKEIYNNVIVAGWDLFVQNVAYLGIADSKGLFNSDDKVMTTTINNASATGKGFEGCSDAAVTSLFNGIFQSYLVNSNMNIKILPDTILVPTFVQSDLVSRMSSLYTSTLYQFIIDHNLGQAQYKDLKLQIVGRPDLDTLGTGGHGRIVAYKKDKSFVRIDIPYPIQHYITLPNIERMSYTSAFVGQVSAIQLPYNTSNTATGVVTYWDFTK